MCREASGSAPGQGGPQEVPPASTDAVGTAQRLRKTNEENERKGTGEATSSPGPTVPSMGGGGGAVTTHPSSPPRGRSACREEAGLFTVGLGPLGPCHPEPPTPSPLPAASWAARTAAHLQVRPEWTRDTAPPAAKVAASRGPSAPRVLLGAPHSLCSVHLRPEAGLTSRWLWTLRVGPMYRF